MAPIGVALKRTDQTIFLCVFGRGVHLHQRTENRCRAVICESSSDRRPVLMTKHGVVESASVMTYQLELHSVSVHFLLFRHRYCRTLAERIESV